MKKKYLLITICTLTISVFSSDTKNEISNLGTMLLIHKTPTCGCCKEWVKHVKENGFNVHTQDHQSLLEIKNKHNINPEYRSCHTAVSSDGYVFEAPFQASQLGIHLVAHANGVVAVENDRVLICGILSSPVRILKNTRIKPRR